MTVTPQQQEELQALVEPIVKWLNDNCHPHVSVQITPVAFDLSEGICFSPIIKYLKD